MPSRRISRWIWWLGGAVVGVVVLAVGGSFIYIHFVDNNNPAPLSLPGKAGVSGSLAAGTPATGTVAGTWTIGTGSKVQYRVKEVLFGQNHTAVGQTKSITGGLTIGGTKVTAAAFTVRMSTIHSDEAQRDVQFDGRIMDVATYPTSTFKLTSPISLAPLPAVGTKKAYTAHGELTLHGHTRPVTFTLSAERVGGSIEVDGSIPVLFSDWDIPNPSFTGFVTTQNHGLLEFLLVLER